MRLIILAVLLATPALAEDPVTAAEFEALVEGRTLTYGAEGSEPYGVEHYHPGRRVTWAWIGDDQCQTGTWYDEGPKAAPAICFVYDYDPEPKCWKFFREGENLRAVFLNDAGATVLYEIVDDPGSLVCGGVGA